MLRCTDVAETDAGMTPRRTRRHRAAPAIVGVVATCAALFGGASSAWAGVGFSMVPTVPQDVVVGDTGVLSSLIITNASANGPGEFGYTNDSMQISSISFVPSCGSTASGEDCIAPALDPGVLVPNPLSGTGEPGTACAGRTFTIAPIDPPQGKYSVTVNGAALVLGPTSGSLAVRQCIINYKVDVVKMPTIDSEPGAGSPGTQTGQKAAVKGFDIGGGNVQGNIGKTGLGVGTAGTRIKTRPVITTNASANITLGAGKLSDQATVTGLFQPMAASIEFRLYGPGDTTCATSIFTTSTAMTINGSVGTAQSATYEPTAAGTYRWRAFYPGDDNNVAISGLCNAANESTTVATPPATPPAAVTPPPAATPPPPPPPAAANQPAAPKVCTTPPGPASAGGELCARGTAAIRGRTGCQGSSFNVVVSGRQIDKVVFTMDGRVVRTLTSPNSGTRYVLKVNPRTMGRGVHRILARTTFRKQSGTRARTLRTTFSLCARRATSPAFTG